MDVLEENFYHNNGEISDIYGVLGNCVSRNVFFIIRHEMYNLGMKNPEIYLYKIYIQNWNLNMKICDLENTIKFSLNDNCNWKRVIKKREEKEFFEDSYNAMNYISTLLKRNQLVLITAYAKDIPFHLDSHLNRSEQEKEQRRITFLLVKEKNDFIYFVYTYSLCNKNEYLHCDKNESIGILKKDEFTNMFKKYVCVTTYTYNKKLLIDENQCVRNVFEQIISDSFGRYKGELRGVQIIEYLEELARNNEVKLLINNDNIDCKCGINCEEIRLNIIWSINRKKQIIRLSEMLGITSNDYMKIFLSLLNTSIDKWYILNNCINYKFFNKEDIWKKKDIHIFSDIITVERNLNIFLQNYSKEIIKNYCLQETYTNEL